MKTIATPNAKWHKTYFDSARTQWRLIDDQNILFIRFIYILSLRWFNIYNESDEKQLY